MLVPGSWVSVLFLTVFQARVVWPVLISASCFRRKGLPFVTRVRFPNTPFCVLGSMTPPLCHRPSQFSVPSGELNTPGRGQPWLWLFCSRYTCVCALGARRPRGAVVPNSPRVTGTCGSERSPSALLAPELALVLAGAFCSASTTGA